MFICIHWISISSNLIVEYRSKNVCTYALRDAWQDDCTVLITREAGERRGVVITSIELLLWNRPWAWEGLCSWRARRPCTHLDITEVFRKYLLLWLCLNSEVHAPFGSWQENSSKIPTSLACVDTWGGGFNWHIIFFCWMCLEFHGFCASLLPIRLLTHRAMTLNVRIVAVTMEQKAGCWHSLDTICNTFFCVLLFNMFMFPFDTCPL